MESVSQSSAAEQDQEAAPDRSSSGRTDQEFQGVTSAILSKKLKHVIPTKEEDSKLLESKGFGIRKEGHFFLKDYEVLYLMYTGKLLVENNGENMTFEKFVEFAQKRDDNSWTRFLIFRDLRSRGYVVREGFGFPIDFRVYDRGDYGAKAAKYIVFGLDEGKTTTVGELRKHVDEMGIMGKEAVISVVERRGEVIYYKVGKWRPSKPE